MNDGYFENVLNLQNEVSRRKCIVQDQLCRLGSCDCDKTPQAPCCLLQTELDILNRYSDVLDRELWHLKTNTESLTWT